MGVKDIKAKVKAKIAKKVEKIDAKCSGGKRKAKIATALAIACLIVTGCMDTNPASRATSATYGDLEPCVKIVIGEKANSNTVNLTMPITIGDGALASADSSGSTETQTATPTQTVSPQTTATYSPLAGTTTAAKDWISSLTDASAKGLAQFLKSGNATGEMTVTKNDGTTETVTCKDGSCSVNGGTVSACTDGSCTPQ